MMGTDENVNVTVTLREGVRNTIEIISHWFEVPEHQACLLLSAAVDFDVTQAVDLVAGATGDNVRFLAQICWCLLKWWSMACRLLF